MFSHIFVSIVFSVVTLATCDPPLQYSITNIGGGCPKIKFINNFNMDRIIGWYYLPYSTINNPLCYKNQGQTMYAAQYDDQNVGLQMCCRSATNPNVTYCGEKVGSGKAAATNRAGEYLYHSHLAYVLYTDYDDLTVAYGCRPESPGVNRSEVVYALSRDYTLTPESEARVRVVLKSNGIDVSIVKRVLHGKSIPYTPNSTPCRSLTTMWQSL